MDTVIGLGFLRGTNNHTDRFFSAIPLEKNFTIGSNEHNDLVINAPFIAGRHCVITSRFIDGNVFAYITVTSQNGIFMNRDYVDYGETVIMYPACVLTFVSSHINLFYIQAYDKERNVEYEEKFLVPLDLNCPSKKKTMISVTERKVGLGRQSVVYLANVEKHLRKQIACKRHNINSAFEKGLQTELEILKTNNHVNVLSIISSFTRNEITYTFSPLYLGGNLQQLINYPKPISEETTFFVYYQLSSGLTYLHEKGIIHCDIKPENILLTSRELKPRVLISDFGLSKFSKSKNIWPDNYGTYSYHAPEIVKNEPFTEKVDNWALGIVIFEMLAKKHPFMDKWSSEKELKYAIMNKVPDYKLLKKGTSKEAKDLIAHLLKKGPELRSLPTKKSITDWAVKCCGKYFFRGLLNVRKNFNKERALLFTGINTKRKNSDKCSHPDNDKKEVERIRKRAVLGEEDPDCLLKKNLNHVFRTRSDIKAFYEEVCLDRTLLKKRLLDVIGDAHQNCPSYSSSDSVNSDK